MDPPRADCQGWPPRAGALTIEEILQRTRQKKFAVRGKKGVDIVVWRGAIVRAAQEKQIHSTDTASEPKCQMKRSRFPGFVPTIVEVSLEGGIAVRCVASSLDVLTPVVPSPYLVGMRQG